MKTVRQLAVTRLTEFFELMTDYDFKPICNSVFSTAVWPQVRPYTGHTVLNTSNIVLMQGVYTQVAQAHMETVNMTLHYSVIIRVCIGI